MKTPYNNVYEFGPYRLEADVRRLTRDGHPVQLTGRLLDILLLLIMRQGEIVTKDDLLREIWDNQIVEENNIAVAVSALRRALGETHGNHEYIQTIPRRGYRFVGRVTKIVGSSEREKGTRSLTVMPFANEGDDAQLNYVSEGITDSVIVNLSRIPGLRVMTLSSAYQLKQPSEDITGIGRRMKVDAVLTGRLRQVGDNLLVGVELVDVEDQTRIWGRRYTYQFGDILSLQEEIARAVTQNLSLKFGGGNQAASARRYTENTDAYYLYLKGRHLTRQRSIEDIRRSIQCFEKAIRMDESYALAHAGIADSHHLLVLWNALPPKEAYPLARAAALKALQLDETLSEAHASLAFVEFHDWHFEIAEREFKWAIELDPNNVTALRWFSAFSTAMGNFEAAFKTCRDALRVDPLSPQGRTQLARYYYYARQYERALHECGEVLELNRDWPDAHAVTGLIKLKEGLYDEALAAFRMTSRLLPDDPEPRMLMACGYAALGRHRDAQSVLSYLRKLSLRSYVPPHLMAWIYSQMRDSDNALYWLEKMYEHHSYALAYLKIDPLFDPIRSDKRFSDLLRRIGLTH